MIRFVSGVVLAVGVSAMLSQVVQAQDESQAPSAVRPVVFSAEVVVESTDNRDSLEANKESNIDTYVNPRVDIVHHGARTWMDFYYVPRFRYRSDPSDFQNDTEWMHDLGMLLQHNASDRLRLRLDEKYDFTDDPSVEEGGITIRGDQSYFLNRATVGVNYDVLEASNLDVAGTHRIKRYDEQVVADFADEDELGVVATARHQMTATMRLMGILQYSEYGYETFDRLSRDFSTTIVAGGLEYLISETAVAALAAGWQTRDYDDAGLGVEGMPYAKASLSTTGGRTRISGEVLHGLRDSDVFPFASQEYTDIRAQVACDITGKLKLHGGATYRLSSYDEDQTPGGTVPGDFVKQRSGDEITTVIDAALSYDVADNMTVLVGQRFEDVDSDVGQSYTKNTSRVALGVKF